MKTSFPFNDLWLRSIPGVPTCANSLELPSIFSVLCLFWVCGQHQVYRSSALFQLGREFYKTSYFICVCRQCIFHFPTPASCPVVCAWPTELKFAAFQLALLGMNAGLKLIDCQSARRFNCIIAITPV